MAKRVLALMTAILLSTQGFAEEKKEGAKPVVPEYFAKIGGETIPIDEYAALLQSGMKQRFYHGTPPAAEMEKYKKEVAEKLVLRILMLKEARSRGFKPDAKAVETELASIDAKYKDNKYWQENKKRMTDEMRKRLGDDDIVRQLEQSVRKPPTATTGAVKEYYGQHKELFTTPEKLHVKMILLKVPASSKNEVWRAMEAKADAIVARLKKGADFAKQAKINSGDPSAANGGDLGFIHNGMLGAAAQQVLDVMKDGELSAPVILLEGVAVFKMVERQKPKLNDFSVVEKRATELYMRDYSEQAWKDLGDSLKKKTKIELNDKL